MSELTLYDLASKDGNSCWSITPWKIRLALNYKSLDYKTIWIEFPNIEPTFSPHVKPNPEGETPYTVPTMRFGSDWVMNSKAIAARLEAEHPIPSLHLESPILVEVEAVIPRIRTPLRAFMLPAIAENLLNPVSKEYWIRTREEKLGKTLDDFQNEREGEEAWAESRPFLQIMGELLEKEGGPFFMGKTVSYADFVVLGWLQFYRRIDENIYYRVLNRVPACKRLYEAGQIWLERNDY